MKQGLYFIYENDTIVYIGKTTNIVNRMERHNHAKPDRTYSFLPVTNSSDMALLELAFIDKFKPVDNKLDKFACTSTVEITLPSIDNLPTKPVPVQLSNKRGMRFMKVKDYTRMQEEVITSTLDLKMWNYLVNCYSKAGLCRVNGVPVTITILTKHFNVTRQKVSKFIKRTIDAGFLMKSGTSLLLNPLVVVPYGISDGDLYHLQQTWIKLSEQSKLTT